ncbi:MAG: sporulation initiation factor Spo0A C-terminal domain-containing protein [Clostridia bacterium]|nr:sporulation initiation factor Spo0A C-terminal domain-containing protein [Clostridia bacterium]
MKHIHILITDEDQEAPVETEHSTQIYKVTMQVQSSHDDDPSGVDTQLSNIFLSLGMPVNMKGYTYLRESVKLVIQSPECMQCITKNLYPMIAQSFGSTPGNVERAIRHAIEICWQRGQVERLNEVYGVRVVSQADKPSNSELIALIADRILVGQKR